MMDLYPCCALIFVAWGWSPFLAAHAEISKCASIICLHLAVTCMPDINYLTV